MIQNCENCGNSYDKTFKVVMNSEEHIFDCFECAINKMAPHCYHCDTPILGHGLETDGKYFCCAHCSKNAEGPGLVDRFDNTY